GSSRLDGSTSMACAANIAPADAQAHYSTTNGGPERHVNLIFKIAAWFRTLRGTGSAAAAKHPGENIAEATAPGGFSSPPTLKQVGKIESPKIEVHPLRATRSRAAGKSSKSAGTSRTAARVGIGRGGVNVVGVKTELIVNFALLRIAQNIVGLGNGL